MDEELMSLINNFNNTIILNKLLIKNKIQRKLNMIQTLKWFGFPLMNFPQSTGKKIIYKLQCIDKEGDLFKYSRATNNLETNELLGCILNNALQASGYNIILSRMPLYGTTVEGKKILLDCEVIYETLLQFTPAETVLSICKILNDTYLVKMDNKENAFILCELLNNKMIDKNIIKEL